LSGPLAGLRAVAFVLVALAVLIGLISRMTTGRSDAGAFAGVESLNLAPGQPFGSATFDGIAIEDVPSVRLKARQCDQPIYATPLQLRSVAEAELADRAYLGRPGYSATNVYRGQVHQTFSHFARVLARNPLTPYRLDYFVRFYAPSDCVVDDHAYVEWAAMILAMGTTSPRPSQGG
jgi:hypothetical protein